MAGIEIKYLLAIDGDVRVCFQPFAHLLGAIDGLNITRTEVDRIPLTIFRADTDAKGLAAHTVPRRIHDQHQGDPADQV